MLQTVDRALRLLLLYEEVDQEYRVGEMAAMLGVDKSSASRLAATLANRGFLERAPGSEAFRIGPELGRLGVLSVGGSHNLIESARRRSPTPPPTARCCWRSRKIWPGTYPSRPLWRLSPGRRSRTSRTSAPSSNASNRMAGRRPS